MIDTADKYLSEYHMYDEQLISTIGFEEEDVAAFAAQEGVKTAEGAISRDVIVTVEKGSTYVLSAHSITQNVNPLKTHRRAHAEGGQRMHRRCAHAEKNRDRHKDHAFPQITSRTRWIRLRMTSTPS